nr:MAG TPA: hypothetical protein [Caudoviricetes sp.]
MKYHFRFTSYPALRASMVILQAFFPVILL